MVASIAPAKHLFTVDEYHRMGEAGILACDARDELIDGEVFDMAPIGSRHAATVSYLSWFFTTNLKERAGAWTQLPILLSDYSEPRPDIVLVRWRADFYVGGIPQPQDALLVIEVSDTTVRFDRRVKRPLYSRAGIPEFWLVDLEGQHISVYRGPEGNSWRESFDVRGDDGLSPLAFPDVVLTARQILLETV